MSKLGNLINELCYNGVEYKKLKDICNITIGEFVHKNNQRDDATYPVFNGGISNTGFYDKYNNDGKKVLISARGANAGFVNRIEGKYWAGNSCYSISVLGESQINWGYIYYFMKNNEKKLLGEQQTGSIPAISKKQIEEFRVPVPPLEVQHEIVHILDDFTLLSAELSTELSTELKARQKQYEYYRDKLLSKECKNKVNLGSLCKVITKGTTPSAFSKEGINFIKTEAFEKGFINKNKLSYISDEIHNGKLKRSILEEKDILFTIAGATIGKMAIVTKELLPANTNQALAIIRLRDNVNIEYIKFILSSNYMKEYIQKCVKGSAQPNLNLQQLNEFTFPFPEKEEQNEIVKILEKLDSYTNDIILGLPAEIEARQKQYEYYRDKLLTFKELKNEG